MKSTKKVTSFLLIFLLMLQIFIPVVSSSASATDILYSDSLMLFNEAELYDLSSDELEKFYNVCNALASAIESRQTSVEISQYKISNDYLSLINKYTASKHPELTHYPSKLSSTYYPTHIVKLKWTFSYSDDEIVKMQNEYREGFNTAVKECFVAGMSEYEMVLAAHEYLINTVSYVAKDNISHTAYGAFVRKEAVCQGYAMAFIALMDYVGITSEYVQCSQINHAWNMVKLNNQYYHLDLTFDDPVLSTSSGDTIAITNPSHDYFLVSDTIIASLHGVTEWEVFIPEGTPKASSTKYDNSSVRNVKSRFEYLNGVWYYISPSDSKTVVSATLTNGSITNEKNVVQSNYAIYSIDLAYGILYFSDTFSIHKYDFKNDEKLLSVTKENIKGIDVSGKTLKYESILTSNSSVKSGTVDVDSIILKNTSDYLILHENTLSGVTAETTVSQLLSAFSTSNLKVYDSTGKQLNSNDTVATGFQISYNNTDTKFIVCVSGDADGNGFINSTDYLLIKKVLKSGALIKDNIYIQACDTDNDKLISANDYIKLKSILKGQAK